MEIARHPSRPDYIDGGRTDIWQLCIDPGFCRTGEYPWENERCVQATSPAYLLTFVRRPMVENSTNNKEI